MTHPRSFLAVGITLLMAASAVHAQEAELARGADLLVPFKQDLQKALKSGLAEGPAEAIQVCRVKAPGIAGGDKKRARELADELGVDVGDVVTVTVGERSIEAPILVQPGTVPDCVVLVATIRALKMHGGGPSVTATRPLDPVYTTESLDLLEAGIANLRAHIGNVRRFGDDHRSGRWARGSVYLLQRQIIDP